MEDNEENSGIKFVWNNLPLNRTDSTIITIPLGFHYQPAKIIEDLPILEYDPVMCNSCKSVLNPYCNVNFKLKSWECSICNVKNNFNSLYASNISETVLPTELQSGYNTVEYRLNKKESNWPIFLFVIDTCLPDDELIALKENIQNVINQLPKDCYVGIITFGTICNVLELGFAEFPVTYSFKGDINYKTLEIQEMLGLVTVNKINNTTENIIKNGNIHRFLVPISECEFSINSFLDDLTTDPFGKNDGEQWANCAGLALHVAISLLETCNPCDPSRIQLFIGSPVTIGYGQVTSMKFNEPIRNWIDFEKKNPNTAYYNKAVEFYNTLADRACVSGQIIDIFNCAFNQVGIYEMRKMVEKTGGVLVMSDSFTTSMFKDTFSKIFEPDNNGDLKISFKGKLEINSSKPIQVAGGIGLLHSMQQQGSNVSKNSQYEGNTKSWLLGGIDFNSTYSFLLDIDNDSSLGFKTGVIQIITSFIAGDRSHRLRITTVKKKFATSGNFNMLCEGFDQDAACVMLAKLAVIKSKVEDSNEILKWLDKTLVRFMTKFAIYSPNNISSFKIPQQLNMFPQYIFYLRRSHFVQNFNSSPDEIMFYKTTLLHESVNNSTIMIQPCLFSYTAENPEASPVFLEIENMKSDNVLLLDSFFNIIIWHGEEVCKWRDKELHLQEEYENIKIMLESPQDYAQQLISERIPVPKFMSCDAGTGNERHIKCVVDHSNEQIGSKVVSDGYKSDDITLKKFMDYLKNIIVNNKN